MRKLLAVAAILAAGTTATILLIRKARKLSLADGYGIAIPDPTDEPEA